MSEHIKIGFVVFDVSHPGYKTGFIFVVIPGGECGDV